MPGISWLSTPLSSALNGAIEWSFFIRENFSPSSSNYGRVYLASDRTDLSGPIRGYYLQFGEALSNDAIELFRQDSITHTSVCRAQDGQIATSFSIGIKVTRDTNGLWTILVDSGGGINYIPEASGMDTSFTQVNYFGVECIYTSSNTGNFYFDNIFVRQIIPDTIVPSIIGINLLTANSLDVQFSEQVDFVSTSDISNYIVDLGVGAPVSATRDSADWSLAHLVFSSSFVPSLRKLESFVMLKEQMNWKIPNAPETNQHYLS